MEKPTTEGKKAIVKCKEYFFVSNGDIQYNIYWGEGGASRSLIVFDPMDTSIKPEEVVSAKLVFVVNESCAFSKPVKLASYEILEPWDEHVTWKTKPLSMGTPAGTVEIFNDDSVYEVNVTSIIKSWATTKKCYGIQIGILETGTIRLAGMKSDPKRHPRIEVSLK